MPLLEVRDLCKSFGSTKALDELGFSINAGEIVALMGANGAGKSTFVKVLSGLYSADTGSMRFKGRAYAPRTPAAATRAGVSTVHQSTDLAGIPGLTVADALLLNQYVDGQVPLFLSRASVRRRASLLLESIGFSLPLDEDFAELRPADRQMVAIARALANSAELLILDEPTASLSHAESQNLYRTLLALKQKGIAILYISHRTADLQALADRVVVMRGGRAVVDFAKPIDFDLAIEAMVGRQLSNTRPLARALKGEVTLELTGVRLLDDSEPFDLRVHRGEVVAITGVLGAGKSRLLKTIFGINHLAAGSMELAGQPYRPRNVQQAIEAGVAMVGEDRHRTSLGRPDWPGESIAATISLPHLKHWFPLGLVSRRTEDEKARLAIEAFRVKAEGPRASVWSLSGGNQQKVVLARWGVAPGRLLLLDEPFQGIDVGARSDLIAAIRGAKDQATLIATSDLDEAAEVADRVLTMEDHTLRERPPVRLAA